MNPPLFFEIVEEQVYRSNKCDASSFPFLATLQLNTVVYLSYDDLSRDLAAFFAEKEINVEEERIALTRGEFFPGRTPDKVEELPPPQQDESETKADEEHRSEAEETPTEAGEPPVLAYQKYFFYLQGPLVSSSVKFSEKKSIIGDDDDD
ncbi:Dynein light chain 4 [Phytophthora nicotianae]|uniref:Dynein light chain 4 n=1 Tax=Phytophthora nicotianae TaxID=4792 RepID=A0A0W8DJU4_PHYNI|nr:Dynein light chain 4 [Phytophthora nicotianae]